MSSEGMKVPELRPCPFCGGDAKIEVLGGPNSPYRTVCCTKCKADLHFYPSRLHKLFDGTEEPVNPESHPATEDSYVAWLRWLGDEAHRHLVVCDSDAEGAFRVYRWPERSRP